MSHPFATLLKRRSFRADVRRALEGGIGLYHTTWRIDRSAVDLADEVVDWCRQMLAQMRRPYGLDYVTLAVALLDAEGERGASATYDAFRPVDFYDASKVEVQVRETLRSWPPGDRLSAVLFSWGDLTRELLTEEI
ncbi:MAG: hypothetical protein WEE64_11780 [Dehalococcoidia bacterium]